MKELARSFFRILTYSPSELAREESALEKILQQWKGRHIFLFPYLHMGGAEKVHADIAATIAEQDPLIIIHGFSQDRSMYDRFAAAGTVIELPHVLNHPLKNKRTLEALAARLNKTAEPVLFGALSGTFFDLLPLIQDHVDTMYLQHAFLHQPAGNVKHKEWLAHFDRVDHYVFIAKHALNEFKKFLLAYHVPQTGSDKLIFIPNAVQRFSEPLRHDRPGLLFVGRDSEEKRLELFLSVAAEVERRAPGNFRYTVVGPTKRSGTGRVEFLGQIDDRARLQEIYADHDLLLVTSNREGFPMVIMEGMAMGLGVISTPVGDVPERLSEREAMITSSIDPGVVLHEMPEAVIALGNDRDRLMEMRQAAFAMAQQEFAPEGFRNTYRELLTKPASSM